MVQSFHGICRYSRFLSGICLKGKNKGNFCAINRAFWRFYLARGTAQARGFLLCRGPYAIGAALPFLLFFGPGELLSRGEKISRGAGAAVFLPAVKTLSSRGRVQRYPRAYAQGPTRPSVPLILLCSPAFLRRFLRCSAAIRPVAMLLDQARLRP